MSETESTSERRDRETRDGGQTDDTVEVIAASSVRIVLGVLGLLLLLFAVGQITGFDAITMLSDALDTTEARWTIVAIFAVILIGLSIRGFR